MEVERLEEVKTDYKKEEVNKVQPIESENGTDEYLLIRESNMFDENWYLEIYPDVAKSGTNPLDHYIEFGWKEKRSPSPDFSTSYYLENNPDVVWVGMNPLVHYILFGKNEGRAAVEPTLPHFNNSFFYDGMHKHFEQPIEIILPVYNSYEYVKICLLSVVKNTDIPYRLLIIDDASTDERITKILNEYALDFKEIEIYKNKKNLGFIKTVNRGMEMVHSHFVILNTDTEVPPGWLERLMLPIYTKENIATTTPFTNAGTICSFPEWLVDNSLMNGFNVDKIDSFFARLDPKNYYYELPTGVGFCMGMNYNVLQQIGKFDLVFGKGYGEENDWCRRAKEAGYYNIIVPNLFVFHKHGISFSNTEKTLLWKINRLRLLHKHPTYEQNVSAFISENPMHQLRQILLMLIDISNYSQGVELIITHNFGGGSQIFVDRRVELNKNNNKATVLIVPYDDDLFSIGYSCTYGLCKFHIRGYDDFEYFIKLFLVRNILVSHLINLYSPTRLIRFLYKIKEVYNNIKFEYAVHDFYCICPSYNLLDYSGVYCEVPQDIKTCRMCLGIFKNRFSSKKTHPDITNWRGEFCLLFNITDRISCYSASSFEILLKAYPNISKEKLVIEGHFVSTLPIIYKQKTNKFDSFIIGVLGNIEESKGLNLLMAMYKIILAKELSIKIVIIGITSFSLPKDFIVTGAYSMETLPLRVKAVQPDIIFIPSICPETFSYTTKESCLMGFPVVVNNLGAPPEHLAGDPKNLVVSEVNALTVLREITEKYGRKEYAEKLSAETCLYIDINKKSGLQYNQVIIDNKQKDINCWYIFCQENIKILHPLDEILAGCSNNQIYGLKGNTFIGDKYVTVGSFWIIQDDTIMEQSSADPLTQYDSDMLDPVVVIIHQNIIRQYDITFPEIVDEDSMVKFIENIQTRYCINFAVLPIPFIMETFDYPIIES